ncbi:hypothetical protein HK096_002534 [Nowakowskiella sp. JEL0078]|nr:hypothetical protein HK096_002534 [Nowakowskiella sp. JEL0078]
MLLSEGHNCRESRQSSGFNSNSGCSDWDGGGNSYNGGFGCCRRCNNNSGCGGAGFDSCC